MSQWLTIILSFSLIGFFIGIVYIVIRARRWTWLGVHLIIMGVVIFLLNHFYGFPRVVEAKGSMDETILIVSCYICMVVGMAAQYIYQQAQSGSDRIIIKLTPLLMPIFVSPIVFIPLLAIIQDLSKDYGAFTKPKLMLYFIAFQNGFFWKDIFERQRQRISGNSKTS